MKKGETLIEILNNQVLELAIKKYGVSSQLDIAAEECAELIQAIMKYKRYGETKENIKSNLIEEIADVKIMIDQLYMIFDDFDEITDCEKMKIKRLSLMMEE